MMMHRMMLRHVAIMIDYRLHCQSIGEVAFRNGGIHLAWVDNCAQHASMIISNELHPYQVLRWHTEVLPRKGPVVCLSMRSGMRGRGE